MCLAFSTLQLGLETLVPEPTRAQSSTLLPSEVWPFAVSSCWGWGGMSRSEMNVGLMARARGSSSIISTYVTSHVTSPPCATSVLNPGRLTRSVWAVRGNSLAIKMFFKKVKLLLENRKKLRDLENKLMVARGKGWLGSLGRSYTYSYIQNE